MYVKSEKIYCHLEYGYFVTVKRCYCNKNVAQMILYSDSTHNWVFLQVINEISVFVLKIKVNRIVNADKIEYYNLKADHI